MIESDDDRLAYLESMGEPWSCAKGSFFAIFDRAYLTANGIEDASPALTARSSDVEALGIRKDSALTANGTTYRAVRLEPDGTGITTILLGA